MNINKINFSFLGKTQNTKKQNVTLKPMQYDSVSFKGNKATQYGSDAILDILRKCSELLSQGQNDFVVDAFSLIQAGKINEAMAKLSSLTLPNGAIVSVDNGVKVLAKNWDGSAIEHVFEQVDGFKNLGLVKKVDDIQKAQIFQNAFNAQPKTTVGMVGWTNIKPENVSGENFLSKAELTKKYEEAIEEFYAPIQRYFKEGIGVKQDDIALVSSVSYSGVDKAIMDLGQNNGINTLTVTPFDYSIYGRKQHPFPTLITDSIAQYVDVYGKMSDNIVVTGGRDHAFKFDAGGKWLRQNEGRLIPIDVLKDYKGIILPSTINGKIENAAALAYETFSDPLPRGLVEEFRNLPSDSLKQDLTHPAQKALASAIWQDLSKNGFGG